MISIDQGERYVKDDGGNDRTSSRTNTLPTGAPRPFDRQTLTESAGEQREATGVLK